MNVKKSKPTVTVVSIAAHHLDGEMVPPRVFQNVAMGCRGVIEELGPLSSMVESITVNWVLLNGSGCGPDFCFRFVPVAGIEGGHSTDFRFIAKKGAHPTAREIVDHFCSHGKLRDLLTGHSERCRAKLLEDLAKLPSPDIGASV